MRSLSGEGGENRDDRWSLIHSKEGDRGRCNPTSITIVENRNNPEVLVTAGNCSPYFHTRLIDVSLLSCPIRLATYSIFMAQLLLAYKNQITTL